MEEAPSKSSLSEFRDKVSFYFFEDIFKQDLKRFDQYRKKFRGFYIYAIDGDQYNLPVSDDILRAGYRGWPCRKQQETHYPKMYITQVFDVVNELVTMFKYSMTQDETYHARSMVMDLEKNSISIYDRLHCGYNTLSAHQEAGNYFIIRARSTGGGARREIKNFRDSKRRSDTAVFYKLNQKTTSLGIPVRLVKIKNPRSGEDLIFITNLSKNQFADQDIAKMYQRRWGIEGSFRDQTSTLKSEQWHSKKLNGILQEIYASLWLMNAAKIECSQVVENKPNVWLDQVYKKSNFKLCVSIIIENIQLLIEQKTAQFREILFHWLRRSLEKRKHLSRQYPRVVKLRGQDYGWANLVPRRLTERH